MSFWSTEEGEDLKKDAPKDGSFDGGGGDFEPIPNNTTALAAIEEVKWVADKDTGGGRHIAIRWTVIAPDSLKNRKVTQNLWVSDDDPRVTDEAKMAAKRTKAKKMLMAIDTNAGGKLMAKDDEPTDQRLMACLANKQMCIMIMLMQSPDQKDPSITRFNNWVRAVSAKVAKADIPDAPELDASTKKTLAKNGSGSTPGGRKGGPDLDDDLPF